jgi:2-dehydro-3-deoxyphosphogluconate aldolase / (4S)-4-hydroxy-2-oxoglutarate aldolase
VNDRRAFEVALAHHRLVAILRGVDRATLPDRVTALYAAGVRLIEIALSDASGIETLQQLVRIAPHDVVVGAGTVVTRELAAAAHDTGARYLVTPHVALDVLAYAQKHDLGVLPGALTPTDVAQSRAAGARFVKIFPASVLGPAYLKALLGPYPDLEIVVVGGVGSGNLGAYLEAGAVGVGAAGALASGTPGDGFAAAANEARRLLEILRHRTHPARR